MKLTPKRQRIYQTLASEGAISARALAMLVPEIDQSTVYRGLEFLVDKALVRKFTPYSQEALYEKKYPNHHHAVCGECRSVLHLQAPDQKIINLLGIKDFEVEQLEIVVKGRHKDGSCLD